MNYNDILFVFTKIIDHFVKIEDCTIYVIFFSMSHDYILTTLDNGLDKNCNASRKNLSTTLTTVPVLYNEIKAFLREDYSSFDAAELSSCAEQNAFIVVLSGGPTGRMSEVLHLPDYRKFSFFPRGSKNFSLHSVI